MAGNQGGALQRVKTLLGLGKDEEGPASRRAGTETPGKAEAPAAGAAPDEKEGEAFQRRLQALASARDPAGDLVAGRVHLINVNKIRERMGSKWPRFENRVHSVIKAELKRRLTPHDFFTQVDSESYAIVFGECAEAEARLKVALLSEQILEKLFGETEAKEFDVLGVETLVTKADGSVASQALQDTKSLVAFLDNAEVVDLDPNAHKYTATASGERSLKATEVLELLKEVGTQIAAYETADAPGRAPAVHADRMRDLIRQLEALDKVIAVEDAKAQASARQPAKDAQAASVFASSKHAYDPCAWVEIRAPAQAAIRRLTARAEKQVVMATRGAARAPGKACTPAPAQASAPATAPATAPVQEPVQAPAQEPAEAADEIESIDLDIKYVPMWHVQTQKIGLYLCEPKILGDGGETQMLERMPADYRSDLFAVVDRLALRDARQKIRTSLDQGSKSIVVVPIHFSTLHRLGSRRRIVELCGSMPDEHRKLLVWEILGANYEIWRGQLPAVTRPIQEFGRTVFLRLHQAHNRMSEIQRSLGYLAAEGIHQVGLDVGTLRGSEAENLDLLESLTVAAKKANLECYGLGFASVSMTICASCLGFQHVAGPAIAAPVTQPDGIHTTAMESIYGQIIRANGAA